MPPSKGENYSPWNELDRLVKDFEEFPHIFIPSEASLSRATDDEKAEFQQIERMTAAVRARDLEEMRALVSGDALTFVYTGLVNDFLETVALFDELTAQQ